MSYAGPASRGKRAGDPRLDAIQPATAPRGGSTMLRLRAPNYKPDHSPTVVFAAGVVLGLAVGAGITLLVAPRSGADTRRALARKGQRLGTRGRDAWDDLRDEFRDAIHRRRLARECRKLNEHRDAS